MPDSETGSLYLYREKVYASSSGPIRSIENSWMTVYDSLDSLDKDRFIQTFNNKC